MTAPAPLSRAQRILKYVASCKKPASLHAIAAAVADCETSVRFNTLVAAQLLQLTNAGKLRRSGTACAYRYTATPRTFVDGRHIDRNGNPRDRTAARLATRKAETAARRAANAKRKAATLKPVTGTKRPAAPVAAQRIAITRTTTRTPRIAGERETVAEFLKRGGRIQKLKPGESSSPLYESVRALNDKTMRQRLAVADNDPDTELDDADGIAALALA